MIKDNRKRRQGPRRMRDGELSASYGYIGEEGREDIYYTNGPGTARADARVLCGALEETVIHDGKGLRALLEERGYDLKTLRFTIQKKKVTNG